MILHDDDSVIMKAHEMHNSDDDILSQPNLKVAQIDHFDFSSCNISIEKENQDMNKCQTPFSDLNFEITKFLSTIII